MQNLNNLMAGSSGGGGRDVGGQVRPLRSYSHEDPNNNGIIRFRKIAKLICQWIAERGNLPSTLTKDECPWLLLAPHSLSREFKKADEGLQVDALPQNVRVFYQKLAERLKFTASPLHQAPFNGLRDGGVEAVVGVLRYCTTGVAPHDAKALVGLPIIPSSDGMLVKTGTQTIIVTSDVATVGFLTGGAAVCAHPLATPLLQPFARNAEAAKLLKVQELDTAVLGDVLRQSVPAVAGKDANVIDWEPSTGTPVAESWIRMLFRWLDKHGAGAAVYSNDLKGLAIFPAFTITKGAYVYRSLLLTPQLAPCILRRPLGTSIGVGSSRDAAKNNVTSGTTTTTGGGAAGAVGDETPAMGASHTRVLDLLVRIGIPVLQDGYAVPEASQVKTFSPLATLEVMSSIIALGKKSPLQLDFTWLKSADVDELLRYFAAAGLTQDSLELLRRLPIFELANPPKKQEPQKKFVSIEGLSNVRLLPLFAPKCDLNNAGCFLKAKPVIDAKPLSTPI